MRGHGEAFFLYTEQKQTLRLTFEWILYFSFSAFIPMDN